MTVNVKMDETIPYPLTRPVFVESFDLIVRDLDMVSQYYETVIGLEVLEVNEKGCVLGAGGKPFLTLHYDKNADASPRKAAGLFHTAFLLPSRRDLAQFLKHIIDNRIPIVGVADHLVSEAIYLADPEGNGIEVYADRPVDKWKFNADGVVMDTVGLDIHGLLSTAPSIPWKKIPNDTVLGHIHLQVGNIAKAEAFYSDVMDLDIMMRIPGATFIASGNYHHHIAINIWNSRNAIPRQNSMSGLQNYTLRFNDKNKMTKVMTTLEKLEIPVSNTPSGKFVQDPSGIGLTLISD